MIILHILVWFSANGQFIKENSFFNNHSLAFAILAGPIIGLLGYYGNKLIYGALSGSVWQIRFIGFGLSYLVFPVLTWVLLGETMLTVKTIICILLSVLILFIQIYW
jgi:hypothetical protein